jgi:hypothetical protein
MRAVLRTFVLLIGVASVAVPSVALGFAPAPTLLARQSAPSAAQQLADKYAPIVMVKQQEDACDNDGEPYLPAPVEVVFDNPDIVLRQNMGDGPSADDPIVVEAPTAADLAGRGTNVYLDFPGNPRDPGCTYERWFAERMAGRDPVAYAHIVSDPTGRLALQYWFFFVFNDFNNTHESDWEMIQLLFDVPTAEEALSREPVAVALAQHGGGETAEWNDPKLQRDGTRPIVYTAAGSHATQYGSTTYLGWGENGTGFGCDETSGPSQLVPVTAILVPDNVSDPNDPFAWTTFGGRWGEKATWEYNGPVGPYRSDKWVDPFTWHGTLRDSSLEVPAADTLGPGPTEVFCSLTTFGSTLLTRYKVYPGLVLAIVVGILLAVVGLFVASRRTIGRAWSIYREEWRIFALLGLVLIPVGLVANGFQYLVVEYPPGKQIAEVMNNSPAARLIAALTVGSVQQLISIVLVGPAVIQAYATIEAGETSGFVETYRAVLRRFATLFHAVVRPLLIIVLLALTIVGIPWAIFYTVRWLFVSQAVILDGADRHREARARSEAAVHGHWPRTAITQLALILIGAAPGPLLGMVMLIFLSRSVEFVNAVSSLVYAAFLPFSVLGLTVLYRTLMRRRPHTAAARAELIAPTPSTGAADA